MTTIVDVLKRRPPLWLCLDCLRVATGLRAQTVYAELEKLGSQVKAHEAACDDCRNLGPVFGIPNV